MPQTLIEKIAQKHAVGLKNDHEVRSGNYISIRPAHVMTHDNTGAVIPKFKGIGATKLADPRQVVFALDHNVQDTSEANVKKYANIESFARDMGNDFYPAGRGIGHQIMCEEGYAWPGTMVVASDSHSNTYGGLGCLGTPVVRTDAAAIWATGRTWWQVPPVARVVLNGKLPAGVSGKDAILALCGLFNNDEVLNHAIEFHGSGLRHLSISERLTIANMTTEWGALVGIFPIDDVLINWLHERVKTVTKRGLAGVPSDTDGNGLHPRMNAVRIKALQSEGLQADPDAEYGRELVLDLDTVQPYVSGPNTVKVMAPAMEMRDRDVKINKAYVLSCVNGRLEDLADAADVVRGRKVAPGVELYIAAASDEIQAESKARGNWQVLLDAGAIPLPPGCGACIGLGKGLLEDGEVGISATNRNFKGRMGAKSAEAYLASPAVVAASAISGKIDLPGEMALSGTLKGETEVKPKAVKVTVEINILDGFPEEIEGELIFCHQDNMNTDGIYPGKYTYIDDFTPEQQASVVMENYDPDFGKIVKEGDVLVGGFTFGSGSSREQAATALKYRGIRLVLAGSFSETYKRNALNNGFLVIEAPELVNDFKEKFGSEKLTIRTGLTAKIDFRQSRLVLDDKDYRLSPIGEAAQELIIAGGLENWVKEKL
ncbi:homoaconitase [candidate division LCP-89 bacterium B3_LCP]|uniref:Aconitate hydratase A n=1 Tax=candidate division LCP-89 bacterium B3_LCP TaxID=2012998 RepID=A0A532UYY6_UNCL8|nr:MAG: homoaconitase [candidate division LCP-89 bacterium B3_LCP]